MSDRPCCAACQEEIGEDETVVTEREGVQTSEGLRRYHEDCR